MNQASIDWLLAQQPGSTTAPEQNNNPFASLTSQPIQSVANNDNPFAELVKDVAIQTTPVEPSLWGTFKGGIADLASGYYSNKALQHSEEYQAIKDNKTGLLGLSKQGIYDVNLGVLSPNKEQELKEREKDIGEYLKKSKDYQTYSENMPMPESVRNFLDPTRESHTSWWEDLKVAPVEIALNVTASSGAASLLSLGGAVVGGVVGGLPGAMAGSGGVSGRVEYVNSIKQGLLEAGINWQDPQAFISAINNDELMDPIREKGLKRGIAIGTLDAVAALVGGKMLAPKSLFARSAAKAQGINLPAQVVAQAGLGAGGEATGQYWSEGEITDVRAIAAEAVGEMTFAPVEATATLYAVTKGSKGINKDRLKATNELLDVLNRKRHKAYKNGTEQDIETVNNDFNEFLNIRNDIEKQLKMTDTESLLQAEVILETELTTKITELKKAKEDGSDTSIIDSLENDVGELIKRRDVVFNAIQSQPRTVTPELMSQEEALKEVKAERTQRQVDLEEWYSKGPNPLAAADEEAKRIAAEGGDALEQQLGASNAYGTARSQIEIDEDEQSRTNYLEAQQQESDLQAQTLRENFFLTTPEEANSILNDAIKLGLVTDEQQAIQLANIGAVPNKLIADIKARREDRWLQQEQQQAADYELAWQQPQQEQEQPQQEQEQQQQQQQQSAKEQQQIAAWEEREGITDAERFAQTRQQKRKDKLHNQLVETLKSQHQQAVSEAHKIIDEAIELGIIKNEAFARQVADQGNVPPDLKQQIENLNNPVAETPQETAGTQPEDKKAKAHRIIDEALKLGIIEHDVYARQLADIGQLPANLEQQIAIHKSLQNQATQQDEREAFTTRQEYQKKRAALENHIAEQQKLRDYEQMVQQADDSLNTMAEDEISQWEESLGIPQQTAIDEAAQVRADNRPATPPTAEITPEQALAKRVAYAHQVVDAAITNGSISLLGEPLARQYAGRGEVPPNLMGEADQLAEQIRRLEQVVSDDKQAEQNKVETTAKKLRASWEKLESIWQNKGKPEQEKAPTEAIWQLQEDLKALGFSQKQIIALANDMAVNDYRTKQQAGDITGHRYIEGNPADNDYRSQETIPLAETDQYLGKNDTGDSVFADGQGSRYVYPNGQKENAVREDQAKPYDTERFSVVGEERQQAKAEVPAKPENVSTTEEPVQKTPETIQESDDQAVNRISGIFSADIKGAIENKISFGFRNPDGSITEDTIENIDDALFELEALQTKLQKKGKITDNDLVSPVILRALGIGTLKELKEQNAKGNIKAILDKTVENLSDKKKPEEIPATPKPEKRRLITNQEREAQEEARFEAQLQQIGKEWIKDEQHRFYFSDIIQQLSGTDQPIPANAKLWYDKKKGFYDAENMENHDDIYDAAIERLELLRQSIIDEHNEQELESTETPDTTKQDVEALIKQFPEYGTNTGHIYQVAQRLLDLGLIDDEATIRKVWQDEYAVGEIIDRVIEQHTGAQNNESMESLNNDQEISPENTTPRGFANESGTESFGKMDIEAGRDTFSYNRIADVRKVAPSHSLVAAFFTELKNGDLYIDKSGNRLGVVDHTKGGKIYFKNEADPYQVNVNVDKDNKRKLGEEIRRIKAEQKGKPAPKKPTVTTEETASGTQWVRITPDDVDQLPIGSTIRISTGTSKPTAQQEKKLKEWEKFNTTGTLKEKGNYGGTPHLTLFKGMNGFMPNQSMYPMNPDLIFEVEQQAALVSDNETIKSLNNDQEQGASTEPQGNRSKPIKSATFNTPLDFGKHKDKTINEIGVEDRAYLRKIADSPFKNNEALSKAAGEWLNKNGSLSTTELNSVANLIRFYALNEDRPLLKSLNTELFDQQGLIDIEPKADHVNIVQEGRGKRKAFTHRITYKALADLLTDQEVSKLKKLSDSDTVESPPSIETTSETTPDENTGRTGQGTLEGISTGEIQGTTGSGDTGPRSANNTGESSGTNGRTDGHNELRGSEAAGVLGTDLHPPGALSGTTDDGDRRGGINSPSADFIITDTQDYDRGKFSVAERFRGNIDAIKLLRALGTRPATPEQKKVLAGYVGWGGMKQAFEVDGHITKGWEKRHAELKALLTEEEYNAAFQSTQNAHYTSWPVINAIYTGLNTIGFTGGRLLETSVGVGNFFGMMPPDMRRRSRLIGVELDHITGGIADKLYGNSARIHQPRDFADFDFAEGTYDVVAGNPPFGSETITDLKYKDISGMRIHNYFLLKGMKALRAGGVLAVVVSKGFMDSSANQEGREMMFREARLLGAWRLPNEAFGGQANTKVTTDVIFLQKREEPLTEAEAKQADDNPFMNTADFVGADGSTIKINEYFVTNPKHLLGDMVMTVGNSMYSAEPEPTLNARKGFNWKNALNKGVKKLKGKYQPEENVELSAVMGKPEASTDIEKAEVNGLYLTDSGELYRRLPDLEGDTQGAAVTSYQNSQGKTVNLKGAQINMLKAGVQLARTARDLINLQVTDISDPDLEPLRQRLNQEYDRFIKQYNMINRPRTKSLLFQADITISPLLMALEKAYQKEVKDSKKKVIQREQSLKADIFVKRTQEPYKAVSKVETADQALLVTLGQLGTVDLDRMTELSGIGQEDLISQLKGQIFDDPVDGWVTRDEYLSGNVKKKLRQAEEAGLTANARELTKALPKDVPANEIVTVFGAHWQTPEIIDAFWTHLGGTVPASLETLFVPERNEWVFYGSEPDTKKWRTEEMGMRSLFTRALNNKSISVMRYDAALDKKVLDVRATDAALAKADEIRNEFVAWLWRDEQRREGMVKRYNDLVNTHKTRQYDGSFLSFPGMTTLIDLFDTQANAVWRTLQSKTTLLDHIVGAGKTFTMIASAMEMKRTGLAKKPMFVVPNHLVGQWAEDFAKLYPNSKVLAATPADFNKHRRKEFLARIATGNWDAVIVAHSSFGKMPTDPATEQWFLKKQIDDTEKAIRSMKASEGTDKRSVAQAAKARDRLKNKLKENLANTDKDQGMTWNETGIDALFVDEAHEFKNLAFITGMGRVKNVNPDGSQMAMDLFIKSQALLRNTGGRNLVFATGTPISNSMAELFTMQRYLDYDGLTGSGTNHFDAWARTFGRTTSKMERKGSGKYANESRFAEFINLPELIAKYKTFADTINQSDIDDSRAKKGESKIVPNVKGGKPQVKIAPRSMYQEAYMGEIEYRFENMPTDAKEDNPLWATSDARKAALDMRMVYEDLPDDPHSKINIAVGEMERLYHQWSDDKGTQLVFCDLSTPKKAQAKEIKAFKEKVQAIAKKDKENNRDVSKMGAMEAYEYLQSLSDREIGNAADLLDKVSLDEVGSWTSNFDVYNDVKQKLIARGIPEHEIAFIHDANTPTQKGELFDKVKRGDIRFLIGSTSKMGAGTNVQNRLVGLHHLDAPWRPSDLEQREGRIIRQGNLLFKRDPEVFEVEILRYATEQTYDTNMWQMLEVKALFIQQLRNGNLTDRTAQDVSGEAATAAEMKAASSGDPRIIEMVDIAAELNRLDNLRTTHQNNQTQASIDSGKQSQELAFLPKLISRLKQDQSNTLPIPVKGPALKTMDGNGFKTAKDANAWLEGQVMRAFKNKNSPLWEGAEIATYRGFGVYVEIVTVGKGKSKDDRITIELIGKQTHRGLDDWGIGSFSWDGLTARFNNSINDIPGNIENAQERLDDLPALIEENETIARTPYPHEDEYQAKGERNRELLDELSQSEVENEAAKWLPEFELFKKMTEDLIAQKDRANTSAKKLEFSAKANRSRRLMEMILYSDTGQEKAQAKKAISLAKEQGLTVKAADVKAAQQRIDEAQARRKLEEDKKAQEEASRNGGTTTSTGTENTAETITFTSADEAIKHAQDNKQAITADNGNIRLERSSMGNWQLSVAWQDKAGFDDDSIVMDTDLTLMTGGRGFTAVGDKMVMTFKEDRLALVIRRLYGKMPLQGVVAQKAKVEPIGALYSKVTDGEVINGIPLKQGQRIADKISNQLNLDRSEHITIDILQSPEDLIQEFNDRGVELSDDDKKDIRGSKALFIPRVDRKTGKVGIWRVVGFTDMAKSADDFRASLRHEIIGHFGMDTLHPDDKAAIFQKIENSRKNKHIEPIYNKALKAYGKQGKDIVLDEIVAGLAEAKTGYPRLLWTRIKVMVIKGLRRVGLVKSEITKSELEDLVRVLRARVKRGEPPLFTNSVIPGSVEVNEQPPDIGRIRYRQSDNSADISSPNSSDNPSDNANRFFSTLALAENELIKNAFKKARYGAKSGFQKIRWGMLRSMGIRQLEETYSRIFEPLTAQTWEETGASKGNPITNYQEFVQGMQSLKANKLADHDDIDIEWGKLAKEHEHEYNEVSEIMNDSTVYEVFPDKEYFIEHEDMKALRKALALAQSPVEQAALKKRMMFERERLGKYKELSQRYQALSDEAKNIYKSVEGYHETMWDEHQQALIDKVLRSLGNNNETQAFIQDLKARFHAEKIRGPYFPLKRFGEYFLISEDENGVYYREQHETLSQMNLAREEQEKAGMSILSYGLSPEFTSRKLEGVSPFADQIHVAMEGDKFKHVSDSIKQEIRSEINQLALQMMPDVSAAKSMLRRNKVKGFSDNARRAFAFTAIHQSNRLARTIYGDQMIMELERISADIDSHNHNPLIPMEDRATVSQVYSVLEKQHEAIMNPKGGKRAAQITNLAFLYYLGASAGAGFINLSQTVLIGVPLMGGRFGYRKTSAAVAKATKDFGRHGYNKLSLRESVFTLSKAEKGVSDNEREMLKFLIRDGTVETTQTSSQSQIADQDLKAEAQVNQDRWLKVNRVIGFFFHNAETANREITALATYRLAIAEGQSHEQATNSARRMVFRTHFDYSGANRPLIMKHDAMKVLTIFKQYSQNITYLLIRNFATSATFRKLPPGERKEAFKALSGILFAHATAAGTLGLPMVSWIGPVLAEAFGDDDDDEFRDWKAMYRNWLSDMFGKSAGHAIAKGVFNGFMGVDLHARVKLDDLWISEPLYDMTARESNMHYLLQALGPAASMVLNVPIGLEMANDGQVWKGIEKMMPKALRDISRTARYANEGLTVGRGGYQTMIEEFTPWELGMQFSGISPAKVSEGYEARSAVKNMEEAIKDRRGELMQKYTRAYMEGDYQKTNELLVEIQAFSVKNPLYRITGDGLRQSLKMKYRYKELSQSGIYLPEAKLGLLNEARFAL